MPKNSAPDTTQPSSAAKTKSSPVTASISAAKPGSKPHAKTTLKPSAKVLVKTTAKVAATSSTKPAADQDVTKKVGADKNIKSNKAKLVRDSFTMPESEYALIAIIKKRCVDKGLAVKKSEVLRAAIISLAAQSDAKVMAVLKTLETIKTGRPSKGPK